MLVFFVLNVLLHVITIFSIIPSFSFNSTNKGKQPIPKSDLSNASCFDRCGEGSSLMCSCDLSCEIDETCCEDYFEACFEPYDSTLAMFYKLFNLVEECKYDAYPIVSRCPSDSGNTQRFQFDTSGDFPPTLSNLTNGSHALIQLFQQVPVTDLETGFTFKNISIYQCHKMSERQSLFWNAYIIDLGFQSDGEWQFNVFSAMRFEVFPPPEKLVKSILKCSEKTKIYNKTAPSEKYQNFVNSKFKSLVGRLIHRYCEVCSTANKTLKLDEKEELENILGAYSVLSSFMPLTDTFDLRVLPFHEGFQNTFWKSMTCSYINTNKDSLVCTIDKCLDKVWSTEKGQCKFPHLLELAVLEEEQLISTAFVNQLTFYVECYLTLYAGYEIVNM
ncbi:death inducer-obliterator 1 [Biomphalaria glabrata]|nr:hypothetical protein BgiMline_032431 [Biomphalaria glabrata]